MNYPTPGPRPPGRDYPGYQPGPQRRAPWLWIALAIAVVIIVALSAIVLTQLKNDDSGKSTTATPTTSSIIQPSQPGSTQPSPAGSPTMTCEGYTASVDEGSQPGWHAAINRLGLAYAVPPEWTVAACGVRMGWAKPCPQGRCVIRELGAVSSIPNPSCEKQNLALAGVTQSKNPDIRAALAEESAAVSTIYTRSGKSPQVEMAPLREFTIGTHPAVQTVATVTDIATDACTGSRAFHSMVVTTVPKVEGSVVFLISLRQGASVSPKPDVINRIVETLRSPA